VRARTLSPCAAKPRTEKSAIRMTIIPDVNRPSGRRG
jgi:hypothetical protein